MQSIFLFFFLSGVISICLYKKPTIGAVVGFGLAFLASICSFLFFILHVNETNSFTLFGNFLFTTKFVSSPLENYFACIVSFISIFASFFGIGYARTYEKIANLSVFSSMYNFFILSMLLTITSNNVFSFILLWEIMTLLSAMLIMVHDKENSTKTIMTYLGVAQVGAFGILIALALMGSSVGSFYFTDFKMLDVSPLMSGFILVLLFIGFGSKAGLWPFHFWLKDTYLQAPSNVAALMSGVMIKVGIFAFIKFILFLPLHVYLAYILLIVGGISVVMGAMYAAVENETKSAVAYSTCENAGIIFLGIGAGVYGLATSSVSIALLGFLAALFHTLNHATFKSLLFLGTGFIYANAGTNNMDKLGGIAKKAPIVAFSFLIATIAITALPPLNGFASEWLTYKSLLLSGTSEVVSARAVFVLAILLLAFGGVMALFAFAKVYGAVFSGLPRDKKIYKKINEDNIYLKFPLLFLAFTCIILGLGFEQVVTFISSILDTKLNLANLETSTQSLNLPLLSIIFILCLIVGYIGLILFKANFKKARITEPWASGYKYDSNMQIASNPFSGDLRRMFGFFYRHKTKVIEQDGYFGKVTYKSETEDVVHSWVDRYIVSSVDRFAHFLQGFQNGLSQVYTAYILLYLCVMLIYIHYFL